MKFWNLISIGIVLPFSFLSLLLAQKPAPHGQLEILPDEQEAYVRLNNMRVSQETGAPLALYKVDYPVYPDTPLNMAWQYLRENADLLKIKNDLSDLQFSSLRETPGGYHVRFQQFIQGYPVYQGNLVVNINRQNRVTFVMNSYKPLVRLDRSAPAISLLQADGIARNYLQIKGKLNYREQETMVYYQNRQTRLVNKISLVPAEFLIADWEVLVDAMTGEIVKVTDRAVYSPTTGRGRVFDPDPLTLAGAFYQTGGQFGDNGDNDTDSLVAQIVWRDLLDIEFYNNQYHLEGPYAFIQDFEAPYKGLFIRPDSLWDFTRFPDAFEAVNVYHHVDKSMRYINDTLNFDLMPFQYTTGVQVDPHGLNGDDNSHYLPSTGQIALGEGGVDDSEDEDVILHELGHGIHDWVTNGNLSQVDGLSEGCADYWAVSYNRSRGFWSPAQPQFNWVFHWDGHNEFWSGRIINYTATYPGGLTGVIHTDGQIWSSTLMQIWNDIGRTACDENLLEALSMLNGGSNQEDAAQAFVEAEVALHGGANLVPIEYWFTQRGYQVTIPLIGPVAPADFTTYSDYQTPTSIHLTWEDPVYLANGDTLLPGDFQIFLQRDGVLIDTLPAAMEEYGDSGLNDGQLYEYTIFAKLNSNGMQSPSMYSSWIAGGSPVPMAPYYVTITNLINQIKFTWRDPADNIDGTPMDDFAGVCLYRNDALFATFSRSSSDTARLDSAVISAPAAGFSRWHLTVFDNELPQNESEPSLSVLTPLNAPIADHFNISGSPDSTIWSNDNADINDRALNAPSGPYSLNLNGKTDGGDVLDLYPVDLAAYQNSGIVFSYYYQPMGQGNAPEPGDSLLVYFMNSLGNWVLVAGYPGMTVQPFQQEIFDLATTPNGGGSYFHSQFQVRLRSIGSASIYTPNDDWFVDNVYLGIPAPVITASLDTVLFDTTLVDSISTMSLEISNSGFDTLQVSQVFSSSSEFSSDINSFSLASGANQLLNVSFAPVQAGVRNGWLRLVNNDPVNDTLNIYLVGIGEGVTVLENKLALPKVFAVQQNYPNPFNPLTTIYYELPRNSEVKLVIYNLLGQEVRTLLNSPIKAGRHQVVWNGTNDSGTIVASGIYIYRFEAGEYSRVMKMILLK
jgi:hypothetical protein